MVLSSILTHPNLMRCSKAFLGSTFLASFAAATYYRPLPLSEESFQDDKKSSWNSSNDSSRSTSTMFHQTPSSSRPERNHHFFLSQDLPYIDRHEIPFLLSLARSISITVTTLAIRIFMNTYGEYHIHDDDHYQHFLTLVLGGDGRSEQRQGLLTLSNHRSLFDDPGVVSCILPLWIGLQPKFNRWGICSQEYCFHEKLPSLVKGYIGAGQVLPIYRGGGINQSLFQDFCKILGRGKWCHIFPEGGVWQWKELGGRGRHDVMENDAKYVTKKKLKWGVGKLIAHHPSKVRVVPFAHVGMENLLPQDPVTRKTYLKKKFWNGEKLKLFIRFGKEIEYQDLIDDFESKHGKLWKYSNGSQCDGGNGDGPGNDCFISTVAEMELYSRITERIEDELESLTQTVVVPRDNSI